MNTRVRILLLSFLFFAGTLVQAEVSLPHFFSDNMVLQRDMPIHIWGWADRYERVSITFKGRTEVIKANRSGTWSVHLPAMHHGGPFKMIIQGKENTITFDNILLGDVWICSGQSNMEFRLAEDYTGAEEVKKSKNKDIRLLIVPRTIQTREQKDILSTSWKECNPESAEFFSALAYFFGKNLHQELDVPIGLIEACLGGSNIETWISWEASMNNKEFAKFQGHTIDEAFGHSTEELNTIFNALMSGKDDGMINKWYLPDVDHSGWRKVYAPGAWEDELKDDDGIVWFRREITLPSFVEGKKGTLRLGLGKYDQPYFNGLFVGSPNEIYSTDNAEYEVRVKSGINLIAVRFQDLSGPGSFWRADTGDFSLEVDGKKYSLKGTWEYKPAIMQSETGLKIWGIGIPNNFASLLYNGMIHPLTRYGIKGVIWYQGESNAGEAFKYRTLFPNLIKDWRKQWGYDFPFLWVQLASFQQVEAEPGESAWAELREAQNMTLSLPNTGQTVITDIGDAFDIHPRNKKDAGYRLAWNALEVAYGMGVLGSGPVYNGMIIDDNQIIVRFSHTGSGLSTRENNKYGYVYGFSIAGEDKEFVWAKAYIKADSSVVVFSDKVAHPVAVRYGWAINPTEINIVNSAGMLASPFRTDNWKGITEQKP